jgi:hypothetical protein|tara:strand:+ start:25885 stop:26316 length:432 start_codon:yes stop_codon:yes gene_type:complete
LPDLVCHKQHGGTLSVIDDSSYGSEVSPAFELSWVGRTGQYGSGCSRPDARRWARSVCWSIRGFTDGLGIIVVVLAALAVRSVKAGRNDPGIVAEPGQLPSPVASAGAGLHANQARWQLRKERQQFGRFKRLRTTTLLCWLVP